MRNDPLFIVLSMLAIILYISLDYRHNLCAVTQILCMLLNSNDACIRVCVLYIHGRVVSLFVVAIPLFILFVYTSVYLSVCPLHYIT